VIAPYTAQDLGIQHHQQRSPFENLMQSDTLHILKTAFLCHHAGGLHGSRSTAMPLRTLLRDQRLAQMLCSS
jgi:hypothetical protein